MKRVISRINERNEESRYSDNGVREFIQKKIIHKNINWRKSAGIF